MEVSVDRDVEVSKEVYVALLEALKPEERMINEGLVLISPTPEGPRRLTFKPKQD